MTRGPRFLNLGIVAHVDAGKTSLSEALLHAAGAIDAAGSVDEGTTRTDSLDLERRRGITIRAAVAAFTVGDVTVHLIDTPGHPDFIAEVDRSLSVLDGAVIVVSAVEGVQAQTVVLMRALRRLRVPTLVFVNKIDRSNADPEGALSTIRQRLTRHAVPMGVTRDTGGRPAALLPYDDGDPRFADVLLDALADDDEDLLATIVDERGAAAPGELRAALARQSAAGRAHPVFFGSAMTGAGVPELMGALTTLLPVVGEDRDGPASGLVFKVEREPDRRKVAYVRMLSGSVRVRERLTWGTGRVETVTAVRVFEPDGPADRDAVRAGQIAKLYGLRDVRVGDVVGAEPRRPVGGLFAPPTQETAVLPADPAQRAALHTALAQLAEQDPLINLRQDDGDEELFVSLYGEVQKEVIEHTLAVEFGIDVTFSETTTICVERPVGTGRSVEWLGDPGNPFLGTIGLTVEPGPVGGGLEFRLAAKVGDVPLYVFKTVEAFHSAMEEYVRATLRQGLSGWNVTDCVVTMTHCGYSSPGTTAGDFRKLTPLVVMTALRQAGTVVCEPLHGFHLEAPADTLSAVLKALAQHRAVPRTPTLSGTWAAVEGTVPAAEVSRLQRELPGRTGGEGVLEARFERYEPVAGPAPTRLRSDNNPLNRKEYLLRMAGRA